MKTWWKHVIGSLVRVNSDLGGKNMCCGWSCRSSSAPVEPGNMTEAAHVQSFLFPGHSSCILQLLAFIRQKQEWIHQLIHTEEQKAFGEGGNPQACSDGSECNVQQFIFIYIFIEYIQNNSETQNKTPDISFYTNTKRRRTNFFFLNKKNSFCSFLCKSATQSK